MNSCASMGVGTFFVIVLAGATPADDEHLQLLRDGFAAKSPVQLQAFCDKWEQETRAFLKKRAKSQLEITREVEQVWLTFVDGSLSNKERSTYFVVQNSIDILMSAELASGKDEKRLLSLSTHIGEHPDYFTLKNFAPKQLLKIPRVVRLDDVHEKCLVQFLGNTDDPLPWQRDLLRSDTRDFKDRADYLATKLPVLRRHWGSNCWLESLPFVSLIVINPAFDSAIVDYRAQFGGGIRACRKVNGKWVVLDGDLVQWIE